VRFAVAIATVAVALVGAGSAGAGDGDGIPSFDSGPCGVSINNLYGTPWDAALVEEAGLPDPWLAHIYARRLNAAAS